MLRTCSLLAVLLQALWAIATGHRRAECEVLVNIDSGPVCGIELLAENSTMYYSFLGIPYAKPPVRRRRFGRSEPPDPWNEPLQATVEGPACPQKDFFYGHMPVQIRGQSEDCLYANIHIPGTAVLNNAGLPIIVVIHGGSFNCGSGNTDIYGPQYFMVKQKVMVVTFNYRLNVFGFLNLNIKEIPGNDGLRDMVVMLQWLKRNAQAFGGDPDNVTLIGQGGGATLAHFLSLSESTEGLINRVILLSGTAIPSYFTTSQTYVDMVNNMFFEKVGINSTDPNVIYDQLIEMPLNKIMYANSAIQYELGIVTFPPVVEKDYPGVVKILDDEPYTLIGRGRGNKYPLLVSSATHEMELLRWILIMLEFLNRLKTSPEAILSPQLVYNLPSEEVTELVTKVQDRYFNGTDPTTEQLINCLSDIFIKYPVLKLVEWRAATSGAPVYLSQFSYVSKFNVIKHGLWIDYEGTSHVEDQTFLLRVNSVLGDYISFPPKTIDDQMKEWMISIVHNFIFCSNPTCLDDSESPWPSVQRNKTMYNDNREPMVYNFRELTQEQRDMVKFLDTIDVESRTLSEKLGTSTT